MGHYDTFQEQKDVPAAGAESAENAEKKGVKELTRLDGAKCPILSDF